MTAPQPPGMERNDGIGGFATHVRFESRDGVYHLTVYTGREPGAMVFGYSYDAAAAMCYRGGCMRLSAVEFVCQNMRAAGCLADEGAVNEAACTSISARPVCHKGHKYQPVVRIR